MSHSLVEYVAAGLFGLAILHTFLTAQVEHLAHRFPAHRRVLHLLAEVEVVFGVWAMALVAVMMALDGMKAAVQYLDTRNFTEPMFVFAIMVVAATRPVLQTAARLTTGVSRLVPMPRPMALYFSLLTLVPLLGSLLTEPAAMTLAALMLARQYFKPGLSPRLQYATLGTLFVNVSIGGTLTHFAAPPVLMVAGTWHWDTAFMLTQIGWKAAIAVVINALAITLLFARELKTLSPEPDTSETPAPLTLTLVHLLVLAGIVVFAHHPAVFIGLLLMFVAITQAYPHHQDRLILREALMVGYFLAGLVVLGGLQQWWLEPLLMSMSSQQVYVGATLLTAITDNAALTYLGSLVEGLSDEFKYALVTGAVTGGGLTLIANAPNPAGAAILKKYLPGETVNALHLVLAAIPPTLVAIVAFEVL